MLHHLCYQSHWEEKEKGSERGFEDIVAENPTFGDINKPQFQKGQQTLKGYLTRLLPRNIIKFWKTKDKKSGKQPEKNDTLLTGEHQF